MRHPARELDTTRMNDPTHQTSNPRETWLLATAIGALYAAAIVFSLHGTERTDELYHYAQVYLFRHGEFRVLGYYLTTIPGYHAAVAALLWVSGLDSLAAARAITALFGLAAAAAFHSLRARAQPGTESLATAQFIVLPVLAPFFFLVYTDVLALALVLWATVATTRRKHVLSALIVSAALLVRQSDVVWAGFLAALAVWPHVRQPRSIEPRELARLFVPYLLPVIAFLAFWAWNGSISLSRVQAGAASGDDIPPRQHPHGACRRGTSAAFAVADRSSRFRGSVKHAPMAARATAAGFRRGLFRLPRRQPLQHGASGFLPAQWPRAGDIRSKPDGALSLPPSRRSPFVALP